MTRRFLPAVKDAPYLEDVRADRHTFQKGSINDPALQSGTLYLNAAHTAYLYLDDLDDLYYQGPDAMPVKLN